MRLSLQHMHQCLNKPAACCCVSPAVEARNGTVDYQKVGVVGNPTEHLAKFYVLRPQKYTQNQSNIMSVSGKGRKIPKTVFDR